MRIGQNAVGRAPNMGYKPFLAFFSKRVPRAFSSCSIIWPRTFLQSFNNGTFGFSECHLIGHLKDGYPGPPVPSPYRACRHRQPELIDRLDNWI